MMQKTKILLVVAILAAGLSGGITGCALTRTDGPPTAPPEPPLMKSEAVSLGDSTVLGVKLLQRNGRALAHFFRADNGIVSCPHFDINTLAAADIPAATSKNWSKHDFKEQMNEKLLKINLPAQSMGIKPGMTVREALKIMAAPAKPSQMPPQT